MILWFKVNHQVFDLDDLVVLLVGVFCYVFC